MQRVINLHILQFHLLSLYFIRARKIKMKMCAPHTERRKTRNHTLSIKFCLSLSGSLFYIFTVIEISICFRVKLDFGGFYVITYIVYHRTVANNNNNLQRAMQNLMGCNKCDKIKIYRSHIG